MDLLDILNDIMEQSNCDYVSLIVQKNGRTTTSTIVQERDENEPDGE